jgi:hypothetical protein
MPLSPAERSGQPGKKRQGRDRVDRREESREILADFNQERRHVWKMFAAVLYERRICFHFIIFPSYFSVSCTDQARGKVDSGPNLNPLDRMATDF